MNQERRKNLIVALLAICAVGMVTWTLVGDRLTKVVGRRGSGSVNPGPRRVAAAVTAPSPVATSATTETAPGTPLEPVRAVDLSSIDSLFFSWVEAPRRDPFQVYVPPEEKAKGPAAADVLSLNAIWRQSGGRFAVINKRVLTEGDQIASFRLDKIDADAVWVFGTNGTERLDFRAAAPAARSPTRKTPTGRPTNSVARPSANTNAIAGANVNASTGGSRTSGTTTSRERKLTP